MKKVCLSCLIIVILIGTMSFSENGSYDSDIIYSDYIVKINEIKVKSYNINHKTYVSVYELNKITYDVKEDIDNKIIKIEKNNSKLPFTI